MDPEALFWTDASVLKARQQKAAAALVALERVLSRDRPLGGAEDEFLELVPRAGPAPADPTFYLWVRIAYQLLGVLRGRFEPSPLVEAWRAAQGLDDAREALVHHLHAFKAFPLAAALVAGDSLAFRTPLRPRLPFAVPGTPLSIEGPGEVAIHGCSAARIQVHGDGHRIVESPVVREGGCAIRLQPHALHIPGFDDAQAALDVGTPFQREHAPRVCAALRAVRRYAPAVFAQLRSSVTLIALKPRRAGRFNNISHSELPGAFIASVRRNPLAWGDKFIHELMHNRLFDVEEIEPILDPAPGGRRDESFYSPWRDDPRPLHGVLHGVYVHVPVCDYWARVFADPGAPEADRAFAVERLLRLPRQMALSVALLERHGQLTAQGRRLLVSLRDRVGAIASAVRRMGLPADVPALHASDAVDYVPERDETGRALSVREAVAGHRARFDGRGLCADLPDDPVELLARA